MKTKLKNIDGFLSISEGCDLLHLKEEIVVTMCEKNKNSSLCYLSKDGKWMIHSSVLKNI